MVPLAPKEQFLRNWILLEAKFALSWGLALLEVTGAGRARGWAFFGIQTSTLYHELPNPEMTGQWLGCVGWGYKDGQGGSLKEKHQKLDAVTIRKSWKEPKYPSERNWFYCDWSSTLKYGGPMRYDIMEDSLAHKHCWFSDHCEKPWQLRACLTLECPSVLIF